MLEICEQDAQLAGAIRLRLDTAGAGLAQEAVHLLIGRTRVDRRRHASEEARKLADAIRRRGVHGRFLCDGIVLES